MKGDDSVDVVTQDEKEGLSRKYDLYGDMLFRLCMVLLCRKEDAEDVVQETFIKYLQKHPGFQSSEHEKAWFIRVATNASRDRRRSSFFRTSVSLDEISEYSDTQEQLQVLEELMRLPSRYKTVLYLHYIEGYRLKEIANITGMTEGAVKTALFRGRERLKMELKEECTE